MPPGGLDAGVGERACAMMLQLLTHRSGRVCSAVYALLEGMVQGMRDSSAGQPLVQQLLCAEVGWEGLERRLRRSCEVTAAGFRSLHAGHCFLATQVTGDGLEEPHHD